MGDYYSFNLWKNKGIFVLTPKEIDALYDAISDVCKWCNTGQGNRWKINNILVSKGIISYQNIRKRIWKKDKIIKKRQFASFFVRNIVKKIVPFWNKGYAKISIVKIMQRGRMPLFCL